MTIIYTLHDYDWIPAKLLKTNRTTFKLELHFPGCVPFIQNVKKEKCAFPSEEVCVVWETWKGVNGRGGYRVEREMYPGERIPATDISRQHIGFRNGVGWGDGPGRVTEKQPPIAASAGSWFTPQKGRTE